MHAYASKYLQRLGSGVGRTAFRWKAGKVIKIVNSEYGVEQNKNEVKNFEKPELRDLLADMVDHDKDNFFWIVAESVKVFAMNDDLMSKVHESKYLLKSLVEAATGYGTKSFGGALSLAIKFVNNERQAYKKNPELLTYEMLSDLDLELLRNIYKAKKLGLGNVARLDQWGVSAGGKVVLVDYGDGRTKWH